MLKLLCFLCSFFLLHLNSTSIYTIPVALTDSTNLDLSTYQGKKMLFVNTASHSSYAAQYNSLEQLYQQYKDSLVVIALPSNSFGNEPDDDSTLADSVVINYHTTFPVAAKGNVTGSTLSPLYDWLENEENNGVMNSGVKDDFQKYLVDGSGNLVGVFASSVDPLDEQIKDAIEGR